MSRPLRSNFPRGSYLWAVRNAQWQVLGIPEEDCEKPKIAIVNSSSGLAACFSHLDGIVPVLKEAIRAAGGVPFEIRTAAPSDFVVAPGAKGAYMLVSRDLVTNDIDGAGLGSEVALITDGHLSGLVCKGLVVAEVSPEGAVCGPLALVEDGDMISIDLDSQRCDLLVDEAVLAERKRHWIPPPKQFDKGWLQIYRRNVSSLAHGAVLIEPHASSRKQERQGV
ncbi:dihydroxy-acid dehydratase [Limnohabitans sp. Rim8]|uniref:dihydroxy-acid dehydratase domain-containing protein n=1 Tax=Limnohabitans sp. Rim8 TaxID=1100718 RepID=UPI002607320E|nr:dihydroxy-acid dehydratase [Limnohabitans sp. Rim8]